MSKSIILCVDDEKVVLTSLKTQLRRIFDNKYEIETAESGDEAIEIIDELLEDKLEIPLIISDQIMPGIRGDELLKYAYERSEKTFSIMLTGQADAQAVGRAVNNAKLYRYISKPWDETDLKMTVKEAVRSFFQDKQIEKQNKELEKLVNQLKDYNEKLEDTVVERTKEIVEQKEIIEKKNEDILASINYAKRIQKALLTPKKFLNTVIPDNFILYIPKDIVSGDFYWFTKKENKTIVVVADCTGHGVPGAFMSMLGTSLLNEITKKTTVANEILNQLRKQVVHTLHQTQEDAESTDGMDISLSVINDEKNHVQFAGAYNSLFIIRNNELIETKADRMPIGIHRKDKNSFTNNEIEVKQNDMLYMFTDGYIDQFGGPENKKFLMKRFKQLFIEINQKKLSDQKQILKNILLKWQGKEEQVDDIAILGIKL